MDEQELKDNTGDQINDEESDESSLTFKQERFCQLYATEVEFFGNGVQSYIEAYNPDQTKPHWYDSACSSASRLLRNVKVINRINDILEETGLNDAFIDKQLSFLIAQHGDFKTKLGAIREYNNLKQRIIKKIDHTTGGKSIGGFNFVRADEDEEEKQTLPTPNIVTDNGNDNSYNQAD